MDLNHLARLLRQACDESRVTLEAEFAPGWARPWYTQSCNGQGWVLSLTEDGEEALIEAMRLLRSDQHIAEHVEFETLHEATIDALFNLAWDLRDGHAEEQVVAERLVNELTHGIHDWYVLERVHGLAMPPEDSFSLVGLRFGRLPASERARITEAAAQFGAATRATAEDELGSAQEYIAERTSKFLEDDGDERCWAWGFISATESSVDRVFHERVEVVALNILRCFAFCGRQSPEGLSLGEPPYADIDKRLRYNVTDPEHTYCTEYRRFSRRHRLALSHDFLTFLSGLPTWTRAREISETPSGQRTDLEDSVFRAMIQFGATTSSDVPEVRLAGYLTALEAVLLGEDDYSDHDAKIGRRLSELLGFEARDFIEDMYRARQGSVHRAERGLGGRMTVLPEELYHLCYHTYEAVLAVLERTGDIPTREALLEQLDRAAEGDASVTSTMRDYPFTLRRLPDTGIYEASCPDFDVRSGRGRTKRVAQERARMSVDAEVRSRLRNHLPLPSESDIEVNRLSVWGPAEPVEIRSYLDTADRLEQQGRQRLRHMREGSLTAQDAALRAHLPLDELEELRRAGALIGLPLHDGQHVYPGWQFDHQGILPGLQSVLVALGTADAWAQAAFMLDRSMDSQTPLDLLRQGETQVAIDEAKLVSTQGGAWFRIRPRPAF